MSDLRTFVRESNRIEGIRRAPTKGEMAAHERFLSLDAPTVADMQAFVMSVAGRTIRDMPGMNVRVGNHFPPPGGADIPGALGFILDDAKRGVGTYTTHRRYETLHPFMDGNGRSGRVLWLWQMIHQMQDPYVLSRGFLHTWYYQSLSAKSEDRP